MVYISISFYLTIERIQYECENDGPTHTSSYPIFACKVRAFMPPIQSKDSPETMVFCNFEEGMCMDF